MTGKSFWEPLLLARCFLHEQSDCADTVYAGQRSVLGRVAEYPYQWFAVLYLVKPTKV